MNTLLGSAKKLLGGLFVGRQVTDSLKLQIYNQQVAQRQLFMHYQQLMNQNLKLPRFQNTEIGRAHV